MPTPEELKEEAKKAEVDAEEKAEELRRAADEQREADTANEEAHKE